MVIQPSGVQFGLKSYAFRFEIRSTIQTRIARHEVQLSLYYIHFEMAEFIEHQYYIDQVVGLLKCGTTKKPLTMYFVFKTEMMRFGAKMVRFITKMVRFSINDAI